MNTKQPRILLLSLSVALALAACGGEAPSPADDAGSTTATGSPGLTLDESALPPLNRFQASDLDTTVNACHDFNAYANGSWLAANDIPVTRWVWQSSMIRRASNRAGRTTGRRRAWACSTL